MTVGTLVGGHRGMEVVRLDGLIRKQLTDRDLALPYTSEGNMAALHNEARMLRAMSGSGFTPELLEQGEDYIVQSDVGDTQPMRDGELFRRNCVRMLAEIRRRGIRHGDLTGVNVVIRDDWPWAVDWQEGHFLTESAPQKQPFSDSHLLWRTVAGTLAPDKTYDTPRVARRWMAVLGSLGAVFNLFLPLKGKTLLDIGCFQGDFCAAAAAEGMEATGIDRGGFRQGEDSIKIAWQLWPSLNVRFKHADVMEWPAFEYDVVLLFSTWSYVVQEYGQARAEELLARIVNECGVLFFENQLYGDGPGPECFQSDEDVAELLGRYGAVEKLVTIPVWGRPAERTVWEVR